MTRPQFAALVTLSLAIPAVILAALGILHEQPSYAVWLTIAIVAVEVYGITWGILWSNGYLDRVD